MNLTRIALARLRARSLRALLAALGIALGVALFVSIRIINHSTVASFRESIDATAGRATLSVTAGEGGFPEEKLDVIREAPGIRHAVPLVETRAFLLDEAHRAETLVVVGVDLIAEQEARTYEAIDEQTASLKVVDNPLSFLNRPDSVILTRSFAAAHSLSVGSTLDLASANGKVTLTVRGLLAPRGPAVAYGGAIAIMDIDAARLTFGKEGRLDRVDLVIAEDADVAATALALERALGPGFRVDRPALRSEQMEALARSFQSMISAFSLVGIVVGLFLIASTADIAVTQRRREIGVLRAIGARRRAIVALVLLEWLVIGVAGGLAGAFLGRGVASAMVDQVRQALTQQLGMLVDLHRLDLSSGDVVAAASLGAFAALLAALRPAFAAARTDPAQAMRSAKVAGAGQIRLSAVLRILFRPVFWLASHIGSPTTRLAQESILRQPKRTLANVSSFTLSLALVALVVTVSSSFKKTLLDWFGMVLSGDVFVSSYNRLPHYISLAQPLKEELGTELATIPGVKPGGVQGLRMVGIEYQGRRIGLKAFDEPNPDTGYSVFDLVDRPAAIAGEELFHSPEPVAFVSTNFAANFGATTGSMLELQTPHGSLRVRVIGIVVDFASPVGMINVARALYQKYWDDRLLNVFSVTARPGADRQALRSEIETRYGQSKNLMALLNSDLRSALVAGLDRSFRLVTALELSTLAVTLLCLFNTLSVGVLERSRELGILRAAGMRRRQVLAMVFEEALLQGIVGAFLGATLGLAAAYVMVKFYLPAALGWILAFEVSWRALLQTLVFAVFTALLAAAYPSWRAAGMPIAEVIRHE